MYSCMDVVLAWKRERLDRERQIHRKTERQRHRQRERETET